MLRQRCLNVRRAWRCRWVYHGRPWWPPIEKNAKRWGFSCWTYSLHMCMKGSTHTSQVFGVHSHSVIIQRQLFGWSLRLSYFLGSYSVFVISLAPRFVHMSEKLWYVSRGPLYVSTYLWVPYLQTRWSWKIFATVLGAGFAISIVLAKFEKLSVIMTMYWLTLLFFDRALSKSMAMHLSCSVTESNLKVCCCLLICRSRGHNSHSLTVPRTSCTICGQYYWLHILSYARL